jgi:hypothetical protein
MNEKFWALTHPKLEVSIHPSRRLTRSILSVALLVLTNLTLSQEPTLHHVTKKAAGNTKLSAAAPQVPTTPTIGTTGGSSSAPPAVPYFLFVSSALLLSCLIFLFLFCRVPLQFQCLCRCVSIKNLVRLDCFGIEQGGTESNIFFRVLEALTSTLPRPRLIWSPLGLVSKTFVIPLRYCLYADMEIFLYYVCSTGPEPILISACAGYSNSDQCWIPDLTTGCRCSEHNSKIQFISFHLQQKS